MLLGPRPQYPTDPPLVSLIELLRRSRAAAPAGADAYCGSMQLLWRLAREPWAQATIFGEESRLARLFAAENAARLAAPHDFVPRHLLANLWKLLWLEPLAAAGQAEFEALCSVRGAEHLRAAQAGGKGVLLAHAHSVASQLVWTWLRHAGFDTGLTLWQWVWSGEQARGAMPSDPKAEALRSARELHTAVGVLRAGGLVQVYADGTRGRSRVGLPLFGRKRTFVPSFAELALRTGAPVLGVFVRVDPVGQVLIDIEPLPGGADAPALVGHYVGWLAHQWREHAANLAWNDLRLHMAFAPVRKAAA